jgi:hypothetical protein
MEVRITRTRVAMAALFVLAGIGLGNLLSPLVGTALATVGSTVNISDHSSSAYFAKVDSSGKLAVGDGSGALSVDGTVAARPAAPASPWHASLDIDHTGGFIAGPSLSPINVTSISVSTDDPNASLATVILLAQYVASSATSCDGASGDSKLWRIRHLGDGATPLSFDFPTPLQWKPPANTKACIWAYADSSYPTTMNAVGFYGG